MHTPSIEANYWDVRINTFQLKKYPLKLHIHRTHNQDILLMCYKNMYLISKFQLNNIVEAFVSVIYQLCTDSK